VCRLTPYTGGGTAVRAQPAIESVVTLDTAGQPSRLGLTPKPISARGHVAHIERRRLQQRDASGRTRTVVHYKVRYRDATGKHHSETKTRLVDAERRKAEIEVALASATWRDPRRGELTLAEWAQAWLPTRFDLRPTTWARLETTMQKQVLPHFGSVPLNKITNAIVREWVCLTADLEIGREVREQVRRSAVTAQLVGDCLGPVTDPWRGGIKR
jgi:hypothetical protein